MSPDSYVSTLVAILTMYGGVTCAAMAVLFWAFHGAFETSGRLFLLSEALRIPTLISLALVQVYPEFKTIGTFTINAFYMASEVSFVCSLYALSQGDRVRNFGKILAAAFLLAAIVEALRPAYPNLPLPVYLVVFAGISFTAVWICTRTNDRALRTSPFWRVLKYIEATFMLICIARLAVLALGFVVTPTQGGGQNVVLVSMMAALLIFRYFSYQSVWMSWASPNAKENRLNASLVRSLRERDELLQQLTASNRRLSVSALASSLAHQLSQPLTGAALQAEAVKNKMLKQQTDATAIKGINEVTQLLDDLSGLVRNLRSLFAGTDHRLTHVALDKICDEVIRLTRFSGKASSVTIRKSGKVHSEVMGNEAQLQQVIVNLLDNAIDAMTSASTQQRIVEITLSEDAASIALSIRDHGPGFCPDVLANPFSLYQTTKEDGTGIGLWLCGQIVERHNGSISVSNHPEGGACVNLRLPVFRTTP